MKKVLYIWKDKYPWDVRVEKFCKSLIDYGYDVHLICRWKGEDLNFEIVNQINIYRFGFKKPSIISLPIPYNYFWKLFIKTIIEKINPDLIIVREILIADSVIKSVKNKNIPVIMDMAENYPAAMREWKKYNNSILSRFAVHNLKLPDITEARVVKSMDGIITVCEEQTDRLISNYGIDINKTTIVHNTPLIEDKKRILPINIIPHRFLHHGWLTGEKSIWNFITAFIEAIKIKPDLYFTIAGDGECIDGYKKLLSNNNNPFQVNLTGKYDFQSLNGIINECDIGVIPYQTSDFNNYTIHNKIFDYFAQGRPVIVSKMKPAMRIIEETGAGIVCDCSRIDDIVDLLINLDKYDWQTMSNNAIKYAESKYNWNVDSESLNNFLSEF